MEYNKQHDMRMWYFYVLQSTKNDKWFYKGSTNDLERRFREHKNGKVNSTCAYRPLRLVYFEAYTSEKAARSRESCVKTSGSSWGSLMTRIKKSLSDMK